MVFTNTLTGNVTPEHVFHVHGHKSIANLYELIDALQNMSATSFKHHVDKSTNHFAQWISDMYHADELAASLRKTTDKKKTIELIQKALQKAEKTTTDEVNHQVKQVEIPPSPKKKIEKATHHIAHLHRHLKDHLHYNKRDSTEQIPAEHEMMHFEMRKGILEFGFGLVLGIIIGLIFAKMMGIY